MVKEDAEAPHELKLAWDEPMGRMWICSCGFRWRFTGMAIVNQHPAFSNLGAQKPKDIVVTDSSFLQMFRYDAASQQLTVVFKNGAEYIHSNVMQGKADDLEESENKSDFYLKEIKGKTPSTKIVDKTVGPRGGQHGNHRRTSKAGSHPRATGRS
jgi:hypothetical protein